MNRIYFILACSLFISMASAQKVAIVESEYIFSKLKSYQAANEKVEKQSQEWQKDIEDRMSELESIYKKFQAEQSLYTAQMKQEKILEIEAKEKEVAALQQKRFGPNGELFKKRQELLQPIMSRMIEEIQKIAQAKSYDLVIDKSSGNTVLYSNPRLNISEDVIKAMGN
ncbi:MAG: OmpH family outer membrane protein [Chitinophagales bacterium]|nr:OmpH family outer membrane protein [Chitinophagales bacterium]